MLSLNRIVRYAVGAAAVLAIAAPVASARPTDLAARHQQAIFGSSASDTLVYGPVPAKAGHEVVLGAAVAAASRDAAVSRRLPPDRVDRIGTTQQAPIRFERTVGPIHADARFDWQTAIGVTAIMALAFAAAALGTRGRRVAVS
jgi:hypothetical protein